MIPLLSLSFPESTIWVLLRMSQQFRGFYHGDMSYIFSEFPVLQKSLQPWKGEVSIKHYSWLEWKVQVILKVGTLWWNTWTWRFSSSIFSIFLDAAAFTEFWWTLVCLTSSFPHPLYSISFSFYEIWLHIVSYTPFKFFVFISKYSTVLCISI